MTNPTTVMMIQEWGAYNYMVRLWTY